MSYIAFVLHDRAREAVLRRIPLKHPDVIAHHVTLAFGVKVEDPIVFLLDSLITDVVVYGYVEDDRCQAALVKINGSTIRPNGGFYHITLSIDRSKGAKPVDSNNLIQEKEWTEVHPFSISGFVKICD